MQNHKWTANKAETITQNHHEMCFSLKTFETRVKLRTQSLSHARFFCPIVLLLIVIIDVEKWEGGQVHAKQVPSDKWVYRKTRFRHLLQDHTWRHSSQCLCCSRVSNSIKLQFGQLLITRTDLGNIIEFLNCRKSL